MNAEELFKYGVTPVEGKEAGKRFAVNAVRQDGLDVYPWGQSDANIRYFSNGSYNIWREPKTLFEDSTIEPTWGNLKKAMETAGLPDDTLFVVPRSEWFLHGYGELATFAVETLRQPYDRPKKHIVVR